VKGIAEGLEARRKSKIPKGEIIGWETGMGSEHHEGHPRQQGIKRKEPKRKNPE